MFFTSQGAFALTVDTNYTTGTGATTEWTNDTAAVGASSLKLYWPLSVGANRAGVLISDLGGLQVGDFDSWSYWGKNELSPWDQFPVLTLMVDTQAANYAGEDFDTYVAISPTHEDTGWHQILSGDELPYSVEHNGGEGPNFTSPCSWSEFSQSLASTDIIKKIRIDSGPWMTMGNTAYVDDISLNGETVVMEGGGQPIPEPLTMAGLVLGVGALGGYLRRRRA